MTLFVLIGGDDLFQYLLHHKHWRKKTQTALLIMGEVNMDAQFDGEGEVLTSKLSRAWDIVGM